MAPLKACRHFYWEKCKLGPCCSYKQPKADAPRPKAAEMVDLDCAKKDKLQLRSSCSVLANDSSHNGAAHESGPPGSLYRTPEHGTAATFAAGLHVSNVLLRHQVPNACRVSHVTTTVKVTWAKPSRKVFLDYRNPKLAQAAFEKLKKADVGTLAMRGSQCSLWIELSGNELDSLELTTQRISNILQQTSLKPHRISYQEAAPALKTVLKLLETVIMKDSKWSEKGFLFAAQDHADEVRVFITSRDATNLKGLAKRLDGFVISEDEANVTLRALETLELEIIIPGGSEYIEDLEWICDIMRQINSLSVSLAPGAGAHTIFTIQGAGRKGTLLAKWAIDEGIRLLREAKDVEASHRPTLCHTLRLDNRADNQRVYHGGISHLRSVLGKAAVHLETKGRRGILHVHGNASVAAEAERLLQEDYPQDIFGLSECVICGDTVNHPVQMDMCGHIACSDCFAQYCTLPREGKFPLKCFESGCNRLLLPNQIRQHLSSEAFEALLQEALDNHISGSTTNYGVCPTPDCGRPFVLSTNGGLHFCDDCLTQLCTTCKAESHTGESCKAYQAKTTDVHKAELEEWMIKVGAKRCPSCATPLEKLEGCNNMTCLGCKAHLCWFCLAILPSYKDVYKHMSETHGDWGVPAEQQWWVQQPMLRLPPMRAMRRDAMAGPLQEDQPLHEDLELNRARLEARARELRAQIAGVEPGIRPENERIRFVRPAANFRDGRHFEWEHVVAGMDMLPGGFDAGHEMDVLEAEQWRLPQPALH